MRGDTISMAASSLGERFKLKVIFRRKCIDAQERRREVVGYIRRSGEVLPWTRGTAA